MHQLDRIIGPHSLERYAPLFQLIHALLFGIGVLFWMDSMTNGSSFREDAWGAFAYQFPASMWAMVLMLSSAASLIGLIEPVHRKLVLLGGSVQIANYLVIAYSAFFTGGDPAVGIYAASFFLPINLVMVAGALSEWKK